MDQVYIFLGLIMPATTHVTSDGLPVARSRILHCELLRDKGGKPGLPSSVIFDHSARILIAIPFLSDDKQGHRPDPPADLRPQFGFIDMRRVPSTYLHELRIMRARD